MTKTVTKAIMSALTGAALALALVLALGPASPTNAAPLIGANTIAIDAVPTGNTSSAIGAGGIQNCVEIAVGGVATVDVLIDEVPSGVGMGIGGMGFNVVYPGSLLHVTGTSAPLAVGDGKSLLTNNTPSSLTPWGEAALPDTDGNLQIAWSDSSVNYESGKGRLYSLTFTSVGGAGTAALDLTDIITATTGFGGDGDGVPDIYNADAATYEIANVLDARIEIGGSCAAAPTPSPTPVGPTPSPTPVGPSPSPTPVGPTPSPTPEGQTPTPTPSPTPVITPSPTPEGQTPSPTPSPTPEGQTPSPTPAPTPTPTPTPTPAPTPTQAPTPTATPTPTPTGTVGVGTATPTRTPGGLPQTGGSAADGNFNAWLALLLVGAAAIVVAGGSLATAKVTRKD